MPLSEADARDVVKDLLDVRETERHRLGRIKAYMDGEICRVYSPKKAHRVYRELVDMSKVNILPLVVAAFSQNLFAEGYRGKRAKNNSAAWDIWQDNRMDLRQSLIYRAALTYGLGYTTTFKKPGGALITPYSPLDLTAVYDDPVNDEWPVYAVTCANRYSRSRRKRVDVFDLLDFEWRYRFIRVPGDEQLYYLAEPDADWPDEPASGAHGMPETPVVRWVNVGQDLGCAPASEVEPLFPMQDQLDTTTYSLLVTQQFAAFRQRWVSGMSIEEDPDGNPRQPFDPGQDRLFHAESPDTKFGEFEASNLKQYLDSRQSTLSLVAVTAQISPTALVLSDGTIANLSADALAALESSQQRKQAGMKTSFGESNEQQLRLGCAAADVPGWDDRSSQIVWRDTESRSLGQAADAANKLSSLSIPPQALWDLLLDWLPNLSQQDLERWQAYADKEDGMAQQANAAIPNPPSPEQMMAGPMMQQQGGGNVVSAGAAGPAGPARAARKAVPAGA